MILRPYLFFAVLTAGLAPQLCAQQQPNSTSSSKNAKPEQRLGTKPSKAPSSSSAASEQTYRNASFGFAYNVIVGWVDRTRQMQPEEPSSSQAQVLLATFERPPEAAGDTINSAVVIAEESAASYPGLKSASAYVGPLTELVTGKGFTAAGDPSSMTIDARTLVRCDFTRELGKIKMYQSTLILLQKRAIVSFTFIGGSEDEVDRLIERLSFQGMTSTHPK
jgi:hypothetical protein